MLTWSNVHEGSEDKMLFIILLSIVRQQLTSTCSVLMIDRSLAVWPGLHDLGNHLHPDLGGSSWRSSEGVAVLFLGRSNPLYGWTGRCRHILHSMVFAYNVHLQVQMEFMKLTGEFNRHCMRATFRTDNYVLKAISSFFFCWFIGLCNKSGCVWMHTRRPESM